MSAGDRTQTRLVGEPTGTEVTIATSGRIIRPLLAVPDAIIDECRIQFGGDGLHIQAVDAANVALIDVTAYPSAFDDYTINGGDAATVGVNLETLTDCLADARLGKRTDDPVTLRLDGSRTSTTIEREYTETTVRRRHEWLNLDPANIREPPSMPDLDLPCTAAVDVPALADTVAHFDALTDHVTITNRDGHLRLTGRGDDDSDGNLRAASTADFGDIITTTSSDDDQQSTFSLDYMTDIVAALDDGLVTDCELRFGDEFPLRIAFERQTDDGVAYDGAFMISPRIRDGGDP